MRNSLGCLPKRGWEVIITRGRPSAVGRFEGKRRAVTSNDTSGPSSTPPASGRPSVGLAEFQQLIRDMYLPRDIDRGVDGTFMWLMEEVGELAAALREGSHEERMAEFADVLAWLTTIANVVGVDLSEAVSRKYGAGCPGCGQRVCQCPGAGKP